MFKILVVEDDADLLNIYVRHLGRNGYTALGAESAAAAFDILEGQDVDLIITDVMMPVTDGFDFISQIRRFNEDVPVLFVTARGDIQDKEAGFRVGADDYMVKPIDLQEMLMRVRALLRRSKNTADRVIYCGHTVLQYDDFTVITPDGSSVLPQKEFQILFKLLSCPDRIFTRQQILDDIWGEEQGDSSHTLDVHISRLRERFKDNGDFEIVTIRGLGYKGVMK